MRAMWRSVHAGRLSLVQTIRVRGDGHHPFVLWAHPSSRIMWHVERWGVLGPGRRGGRREGGESGRVEKAWEVRGMEGGSWSAALKLKRRLGHGVAAEASTCSQPLMKNFDGLDYQRSASKAYRALKSPPPPNASAATRLSGALHSIGPCSSSLQHCQS